MDGRTAGGPSSTCGDSERVSGATPALPLYVEALVGEAGLVSGIPRVFLMPLATSTAAHRLRVLLPSVLSPKRIGALEPVNRPWLYWVGLSTQGAGYVSGVTYRCDRFV